MVFFSLTAIACNSPAEKTESLQSLHEKAMNFVKKSNLDSAAIVFKILTTQDPNNYLALLGLAEINIRKKDCYLILKGV